jgi:alkylation response protein AidB-like acyl-CoA dehydrogenase
MRFLLSDTFAFDRMMEEFGVTDIDTELAIAIVSEGGRFCADVLAPLNRVGDEVGSRLENGVVRTPPGFADAYKAFVNGGWTGLSADPEYGGQGLPNTIEALFNEMVSSANLSFGLFHGLTRGAVEAIQHHASDNLKSTYLPQMVSGRWTGAMALTEASAGTDLGLLKTGAEPRPDGSYKITGTKIFISSGDHDFGGNTIHLVLARILGAPPGTKGISLFLVPKLLLDANGDLGVRNAFGVGSLEHKMGIHAQPTCVINYDGATGWMVGSPNRGLNAMFTMMNVERLFVGIQGLGIGEATYQKARAYARQRVQGRSSDGTKGPVAIIEHPDVRKMLMTVRCLTEGGRALAVWTAMQMDCASRHPDEKKRAEAAAMVALLTPVVKAALTDFGFESAVMSQQVFGGHGYIAEWGVEQFVRDVRITQIYEGTNGVQALDLVGRKILLDSGAVMRRFLDLMRSDIAVAARIADATGIAVAAEAALDRLANATNFVVENASETGWAGAAATDYLRLFALATYGWLWAKMAVAASRSQTSQIARQKLQLARFFSARILPQTLALEASILAGPETILHPANDDI